MLRWLVTVGRPISQHIPPDPRADMLKELLVRDLFCLLIWLSPHQHREGFKVLKTRSPAKNVWLMLPYHPIWFEFFRSCIRDMNADPEVRRCLSFIGKDHIVISWRNAVPNVERLIERSLRGGRRKLVFLSLKTKGPLTNVFLQTYFEIV